MNNKLLICTVVDRQYAAYCPCGPTQEIKPQPDGDLLLVVTHYAMDARPAPPEPEAIDYDEGDDE